MYNSLQYWLKFVQQNQQQINLNQLRIREIKIGIVSVIFLGSIYGLTRPCVFGKCQEISQAQQLVQEALTPFQRIPADNVVIISKQRFKQAIVRLKTIPLWSNYYQKAVHLLTEYQIQLSQLETLIIAINQEEKAKNLSQNLPLSLEKMSEIQHIWQESISALQSISSHSSFYLLATVKIREYQRNLAIITGKLQAEKQALISLEVAKEAAKIAKIQQNSAQSLAELESVYSSWQEAIKGLNNVLPGTDYYAESRKLLDNYRAELISLGIRKHQEKLAFELYNQAIHQAKLAEQLETKNQLTEAVFQWRNALSNIQKIPKNTFQNNHSQPLVMAYILSLNQAENKLKSATKLRQIQRDLDKICSESSKICDYHITDSIIQIKLTSIYIQQVWNTALQAKTQGNLQVQVELLNYFSRFEQSLQILSDNTNKQIAVYNANGSLATVYQPKN